MKAILLLALGVVVAVQGSGYDVKNVVKDAFCSTCTALDEVSRTGDSDNRPWQYCCTETSQDNYRCCNAVDYFLKLGFLTHQQMIIGLSVIGGVLLLLVCCCCLCCSCCPFNRRRYGAQIYYHVPVATAPTNQTAYKYNQSGQQPINPHFNQNPPPYSVATAPA